jgi:hypothetical protein
MSAFREGKVVSIEESHENYVRARVSTAGGDISAVGYPAMLGPLDPGDRVVVNVAGIELDLGTGGLGFILWNLDGPGPDALGPGHMVKLRYTPWQTVVLAAEEPASPHHAALSDVSSLNNTPVVVCTLHSQIAAAAAGIKELRPRARIGYLMTDGAALPIALSDLVRQLRAAGLLDVASTCGHAFGGDLEAVNVFSGLVALEHAAGAHAIVVAPGPGVVGTDSALGHSAMDQGQILDAVTALGGRAVACLRISFADARERHRGVSHHTLTALRLAARERTTIVLPELGEATAELRAELEQEGLLDRHELVIADGRPGLDLLSERGVQVTSMGRSMEETPELFMAAAAAGAVAARTLAS